MVTFYFIFSFIMAGSALAMGLACLIAGLNKVRERVDLVFDILCLQLFIPPELLPFEFAGFRLKSIRDDQND